MHLAHRPRIFLMALTSETRDAIGGPTLLADPLPFRVGRESRGPQGLARIFRSEQRALAVPRTNELYLRETAEQINVSRQHFQIQWDRDGLLLVDRGSTCGTIVEGKPIGGAGEGGTAPLKDGDVIIVGTAYSPFIFKVRLDFGPL